MKANELKYQVGDRVRLQMNNVFEIDECVVEAVTIGESNVFYDLLVEVNYVDRENGEIINVRSGKFVTIIKGIEAQFIFPKNQI